MAIPRIKDEILEQFFRELVKTDGFSEDRVECLRELFKAGRKPKAAEVIKKLSDEPKEGIA